MVRGESYSFGIRFNDDFELTRLDELQLYIGAILVGKLSNGSIKYQDGYYRVELAGATTNKLALGVNPITLYIDDRRRGILKPNVGTITITATQADTDCSVNTGFNSIINVKIDESGVTTDLVLLNAVRGKSAYEYAIDAGYTGTETQFYEDLAIVGNKVDYLIPLTPEEAISFQSENSRGGFAKLSTALLVYYQGNQIGSIDANLASLERLNNGNLLLKTLNYLELDSINSKNLEAWVTLSLVDSSLIATVNGFITIGDDLDRVKYEGATRNLDLGEQSLETTSVIYKEVAPTVKVPLQRYYDAESNTTKFVRLDGGETNDNQEIGGEFTNVDSIELVEKTLVSAVPLSGNRKGMARLDISSKTSVENFLGMVTVPSTPVNGKGLVTFIGEVDANTFGLLENAQIYAGITPGTWSLTPPAKGYYTVIVGTVVVSANNGKVFLNPRVLPKLNDLSDVNNNALEGQPLVKKADLTWQGSDTLKIEKVIPPSGEFDIEGNQEVTGTQKAKDFTGETIVLSGKATVNEIESTTGFKKPGASDNDLLTGAGGKISITTLKSGVYQLFNPSNNTQVVLEVNAAGEVLVHGPIVQTGSGHTVDFETITTKEQLVELRHDATTGMAIGDLAGFIIKLYDGVNDGMMVIDKDGIMRIGDVGDLQPLLTREETPTNNAPLFFNESTRRAETVKPTDTKVSVVDADAILLKDSQDNNKPKWWSIASIKSTLAFYFDTFYLRLADVTQTVAGKITFSKSPVVPNPVNANEALNKGTADTNYVSKNGDATINNVKTFTSSPLVPTPTSNNAATPKVYVDAETNAVLTLAKKYAENPEDVQVVTGEYSAKHYSLKAAQSAQSINESADMLIRHESEISSIENIINSANLNQETTATVTGVDTISLPKTAANGGMQVQMFGQSAENLVVNGRFDNTDHLSEWNIYGWDVGFTAVIDKGLQLRAIMQFPSFLKYLAGDSRYATHKIYFKSKFKIDEIGSGYLYITDEIDITYIIPTDTELKYRSVIHTVNAASTSLRVGQSNGKASSWANQYISEVMAINLTATFGAGNEPTKEQCDKLFANYFEGSKNVLGTGRMRSVGKNLLPLLDGWYSITSLGTNFLKISNSEFKIKTGSTLRSAFIKVKAGDIFTLSHKASASTRRYLYYYDNNFNNVAIYSTTLLGNWTSPAATVDGYLRIEYLPLTAQTDFVTVTDWQLERNSTATTYEPYRESILQLTTPPLCSNGLIKDEIRKGTNGYELVKRVGVGTLGANGVTGGDFEAGLIGTKNDELGTVSTWALNTESPISGTKDGRLIVTTAGTSSARPILTFTTSRTAGQLRKFSFSYKVNSGTCILAAYWDGSVLVTVNRTLTGSGVFESYYKVAGPGLALYFDGRNLFDLQMDNVKDELISTTDGVVTANAATGQIVTLLGTNYNYTLATPTITPIAHAGLLNSNSNGTVYFEPVIADAGVYGSNIAIQLTDYPIASFESIRKYSGGTYTELNTATAVIASGGLSFTHPDLTAGDLVMFTYSYANESIGRSMILSYAISNSNPYYNVTNSVPLATGYYTSTTARAAVPEGVRKTGLILTYETAAGVWYTERYIGTVTDTTSFTTAGNWEIGVLRIASVTDTTEYAEITI